MPKLTRREATEKLAAGVLNAKSTELADIQAELFPEQSASAPPSATGLAEHILRGLEAEEIVDLWNVVFPADRNVWYDEEDDRVHYNEEAVGYAEAD